MKILALFILTLTMSINGFTQVNFEWDKVFEVEGTKKDLYSKSKMFIAETWRSANDVIQNDDKESGVVLLKGSTKQNVVFQLLDHIYYYSYTVKLYTKDNKCRIVINNVNCTRSYVSGGHDWPLPPASDSYPESGGLRITGMNKKNYARLMDSLRSHLQSIVDSFESEMVKPLVEENSDW